MGYTKKNKSGGSSSLTFSSILGVAFIVLKLCGVIAWPWVWVLAPIWVPVVIALIVLLCVAIWAKK